MAYMRTRFYNFIRLKCLFSQCEQVGIEDCLHIEFEYERSKYHLKDSLIGKVMSYLNIVCFLSFP